MHGSPSDVSRCALRVRPLVLFGLILGAALFRLLPHPPNFTPIGAMALFGGALFGSRMAAVGFPLLAMLLSDLLLWWAFAWPLGWMTLVIYACIAGSVVLGLGMRGRVGFAPVVSRSLLSALLFFLVTNFAVWAGGGLYSHDLGSLLQCYAAALPFFGNSLAAYAVFGLALFGGFALLQRRFPALRSASELMKMVG